jgi:glycosyltransferase involved in cell wall biosynthesis
MGLMFFPRGGSAHVARNLAAALPAHGWDVTISSGSLTAPGLPGGAREFFRGHDVRPVDMTSALGEIEPVLADPPLHPSFEDRPGAPDRVFATLDDAAFEHQTRAWSRALSQAGAVQADVLHLHHLTPLNEAVARIAPHVPVVGHLHGTELLMLEAIEEGAAWPFADAWAERMRGWAQACSRLILLSEGQLERAQGLLDIDPERCVHVPNGFDPELFGVAGGTDRAAHWRRALPDADPEAFAPGNPVLLYVGRFTAVKRVGLLIEAYAQARPRFASRAPLVLVGGFPGEHEGEHPEQTLERLGGVPDVFLAGWHEHDALPAFLGAGDAVVLPSVREQFGQVLVEGMACGLPALAVDAHGPAEIVADGETGWLVPPDDRDALADALVAVVNDPVERERRGAAARADAWARFSWPALAARVASAYEAAIAPHAFTG